MSEIITKRAQTNVHDSFNQEVRLSSSYLDRFGGVGRSYGEKALTRISNAHACVVGIGGVGTWAVEGLARSGIGELTLIDLDEICVTNTNRQLHALSSTIGQSKVSVMASRVLEINPELKVNIEQCFFTDKSEERLLGPQEQGIPRYDVLIDAIDQTQRKTLLIEACLERKIPIVTCGAAGGRRSPQMVTVADLRQSSHDGLLRRVKQLLKKSARFQSIIERDDLSLQGSAWGVPSVFSIERPFYPTPEGGVCHEAPSHDTLRLGCDAGFGSLSFVTATFGFTAVSVAIDLLLNQNDFHR